MPIPWAAAGFSLPLVVAVDLCGVVVFDAGDELLEQLDELRGGLVGEARQIEGEDHGFAFHRSGAASHSEHRLRMSAGVRPALEALKLFEGGLDVLRTDLSHLGEGDGGQRVVGGAVDLARQALRGLEQRLDRCGLEQR